jgi:hypothetical protein
MATYQLTSARKTVSPRTTTVPMTTGQENPSKEKGSLNASIFQLRPSGDVAVIVSTGRLYSGKRVGFPPTEPVSTLRDDVSKREVPRSDEYAKHRPDLGAP